MGMPPLTSRITERLTAKGQRPLEIGPRVLANGIPIICAGMTEDKEEVSAHVQWAGVGIDLRTNQATPEAVRRAAREIRENRVYQHRAQELEREFASHNAEEELLKLLVSKRSIQNEMMVHADSRHVDSSATSIRYQQVDAGHDLLEGHKLCDTCVRRNVHGDTFYRLSSCRCHDHQILIS
jgi:hypothetical protein